LYLPAGRQVVELRQANYHWVRDTFCSKVATLLRDIPNTLKKSSQKLLASASSLTSSFHSLVKVTAGFLFHSSLGAYSGLNFKNTFSLTQDG